MANRIDWDDVTRKQRAQRHGTKYGFDELPSVGSYADQIRYNNLYESKHNQPAISKQITKPLTQNTVRIANLKKTLIALAKVPDSVKWIDNGPQYQHKILNQMKATLESLLRIEPSANNETYCVKIKRILSDTQHHTSNNKKQGLNAKEIAMLKKIESGKKMSNSKPIGIYGSNSPQLRAYKK